MTNQNKTTRIRRRYIWKYIQGAPWKKQYHNSFRGAPKVSRKNNIYTFTLDEKWQNKIKKQKPRLRTLYILKLLCTGCSNKQYHCFFHGARKISRINDFYKYTFGK